MPRQRSTSQRLPSHEPRPPIALTRVLAAIGTGEQEAIEGTIRSVQEAEGAQETLLAVAEALVTWGTRLREAAAALPDGGERQEPPEMIQLRRERVWRQAEIDAMQREVGQLQHQYHAVHQQITAVRSQLKRAEQDLASLSRRLLLRRSLTEQLLALEATPEDEIGAAEQRLAEEFTAEQRAVLRRSLLAVVRDR